MILSANDPLLAVPLIRLKIVGRITSHIYGREFVVVKLVTIFYSDFHDLVREPLNAFDMSLSKQIEVIIIDQLAFDVDMPVYEKQLNLKEKEAL